MRRFDPLKEDHYLVAEAQLCHACKKVFVAGDVPTIVALGPGDDPDARERAREGRPYNAVAAVVHYACATGEVD